MPVQPTPVLDRILSRVDETPDGCWVFTGALNHGGYGIVQLGRGIGTDKVHRVVYREVVGVIPENHDLDHLCHNPACCNPAHLEPVTRAENVKRQWRDGRARPMTFNTSKTHCPKGHPYDAENTCVSNGRRHCRACNRARALHSYHAKKATP